MAKTYLPNMNDERIFFLDVSKHNGIIKFEVVVAAKPKVRAVIVRTGISWGYQDKWFPRNWAGFKAISMLRDWYHVLYPAEPIQLQVDNLCRILGNDLGEGAGWWDVELVHGCSKSQLNDATLEAIDKTQSALGRCPGVYSRYFFIKDHMLVDREWFKKVNWILAEYMYSGKEADSVGVSESAVYLGIPLSRLLAHQTSKLGRGKAFGMQSVALDYDRWMGTEEQWFEYWQLQSPPLPPSPPTTPQERPQLMIGYKQDEVDLIINDISLGGV